MSRTVINGQHADELVGASTPAKTSYDYLFILTEKDGWHCWETNRDSMAFGIWTNREACQIFTYDNGNRQLFVAHDETAFQAEIARLEQVYGTTKAHQELTVHAKGEVTLALRWPLRATGYMSA